METKVQHSFVGKKIAEKRIQNFFTFPEIQLTDVILEDKYSICT